MKTKEIIKIIDKQIRYYKKGKMKGNFTIGDRATAMVVLEDLKSKFVKSEKDERGKS